MASQEQQGAGPGARGGGASGARAVLECVAGPEKGRKFRVAPGVTVIGRDPACEAVLTEEVVSREHARVERRGDGWVVVNLSSNGTRLNKKPVDEAALNDGDVIQVGAKTRLRFVVEEVTVSATGRPQFRARTGLPREEEEPEAVPGEKAEEEGSLFQRRRGLFIGLGVYVFGILVVAVLLALRGGGETAAGGIPNLTRDEIRKAVERKYDDLRLDLTRGEMHKRQALELYDQRNAESGNLFGAVRNFQKALAYLGGRNYFPDEPAVTRIYRDAVDDLVERLYDQYRNAALLEDVADYQNAEIVYKHILDMVPEVRDEDSAIRRNVSAKLHRVRKVLARQKR